VTKAGQDYVIGVMYQRWIAFNITDTVNLVIKFFAIVAQQFSIIIV